MHRHKGRHLKPRIPKEELLRQEPEAAETAASATPQPLLKPLPLRSVVCLRIAAVLLAICVIGIPLQPAWFYKNVFMNENAIVSYAYQLGLFSSTVLPRCGGKGYLPVDRSEEIAYFRQLQDAMQADDETMYEYVQQWLCVTAPDDPAEYEHALLQYEASMDSLRDWFTRYQVELAAQQMDEESRTQDATGENTPVRFGSSDQAFFPRPRNYSHRDKRKGS